MSNRTYICIECRTSKRAEAAYGLNTNFRCSVCQNFLYELPWDWRIPKRNNEKEWQSLKEMVEDLSLKWKPIKQERFEILINRLNKKIAQVSGEKDTAKKHKKLKYLMWQKSEVERKYKQAPN